MPRFMAILIDSIEAAEEEIPPEQWQAMMDDYDEFGAKAGEAGVIGGGEALQPPSTAVGVTVDGKGGHTSTSSDEHVRLEARIAVIGTTTSPTTRAAGEHRAPGRSLSRSSPPATISEPVGGWR